MKDIPKSNMSAIAQHLGISRTTVSYVLSGQAKKRQVAQKTAKRVLNAAEELGYVPNIWAQRLVQQRTQVVGLIVSSYESDWLGSVMRGALPVFETQNYLPITAIHWWNRKRQERELMLALERRDEGVICQPLPQCNEAYGKVMRYDVPLVFISDTLEDMPNISYVAWDSVPAVQLAVQHLIKTGRRRIGYIGFNLGLKFIKARYQMYKETLSEAGLEINENWIGWQPLNEWQFPQLPDFGSTIGNIVERLFTSGRDRPDALFFPQDTLALAALHKLNKMGISVPDDVALMGMGDDILSGDFGAGLSTIREPLKEIGQAAAEAMIELIEHPRKTPIQRLIVGNELKIRKTT